MARCRVTWLPRRPWQKLVPRDRTLHRLDGRNGRVRVLMKDGVPVQQPQPKGPAKGTYVRAVV